MSNTAESPELDQVESAVSRGGPTLMQIAWQRKSLVILGIMLGLVLGLLYYAQKQPTYQSLSQMLIVKKTPNDSLSLGTAQSHVTYMEDYMSTQSVLVKSPEIIGRAAKKPNLQDLKSFANERPENVIYLIRENLAVLRDTRDTQTGQSNNILTLQFRGPESEECREILKAIMQSYQEFLDDTYKTVSDRTLELILEAKKTLSDKLETAEQAHQDFRQKSAWTFFTTNDGGARSNIYVQRLINIEKKRSEKQVEKAEFQQKVNDLRKVYKEQGEAAAKQRIAMFNIKLALTEQLNAIEKEILTLELMKKTALNRYGEKHPTVVELSEQIQMYKDKLARPSPNASTSPDKKVMPLDSVEAVLAALESEISSDDALLKELDDMYDQQQKLAREISYSELQDDRLRNQIMQSRQLLDTITKRLAEINLAKDFGGYEAKQIAPASFAKKVSPNALMVFPISGFAGFLMGLCLAYLAEMSDKSFRTPAEIRRRLGLPVIGHIPFFLPDEKAQKQIAAGEPSIDPMMCTHYASNSVSAEAYRSIRTAIYFNTQGIGHQVIQITSPNMADGKSTLATNLAVSIAQSGKKTILIDADCRRPRIHKILNVAHDTGLASVIAGQSDLATAIRPTAVPNLAVLPCGPRPANPAELLTSPRFKELLDIIRAQYDYVLIDTPPLLVVTDPCVVAPRVDGVLLAIRVTKNGRPFAERAKEILNSLGAHVLGVVVNGLGGNAGGRYGYGYDSYNYGYGYGYTYRYSYTYTDEYTADKGASYYQAPDNPEMPHLPPAPVGMEPTSTLPPEPTSSHPASYPSEPIIHLDDESLPPS
jgi:polysaccharide biosynthesis transport protein